MKKTPKNLVVVSGIIYHKNNHDCILLQKRNDGYYSTPGGKVEVDEDPKEALIRELKEELGITVRKSDLELAEVGSSDECEGRFKIIITYIVNKYSGVIKNLDKKAEKISFYSVDFLPDNTTRHVKKLCKERCI